MNGLRSVEFVVKIKNRNKYTILLLDVNKITSVLRVNKKHCKITTDQGKVWKVAGKYRCIVNRWQYALMIPKVEPVDPILFPSNIINNNPKALYVDDINYDEFQIKKLFKIIRPNENYKELISL